MNEMTVVAEEVENIEPLSSIALKIGPIDIHWYGVILGTAVIVALFVAIREGKKYGFDADLFMDLVLYGVPLGILGGRLYYVIFEWDYYSQNPADIIAVWKGGLAIHGVLIASILLLIWFCRKRNISFWQLVDFIAPALLLAQAIGRWGNFMNQEAHGGVVSRDFLENLHLPEFIIHQMYIYNPNPGNGLEPGYYFHHPTFLYESLWNLLGVLVLIGLRNITWKKINIRQGDIFLSYLIWYSVGRFFIEGMRTDSLMLGDVLRIAQVMSILLILAAIFLIIYRRQKHDPPLYREGQAWPSGRSVRTQASKAGQGVHRTVQRVHRKERSRKHQKKKNSRKKK